MGQVELIEIPSLEASLTPVGSFNVSLASIGGISGSVSREISHEEYTGIYEVVPRVEAQVLNTADKLMRKDISIDEIPYAEVSNSSGGMTATIAFL